MISMHHNSTNNTPAILNHHDMAALERIQQEFSDECGKNILLVAYQA